MIRFECDRCGAPLGANDAGRFIVRMEAYAAAGPIELPQSAANGDAAQAIRDIIEELNHADPDAVEDETYRSLRFDLCARCHRTFLDKPLG